MKHKNHKKYRARLLTAVFAAAPADNRVGKRKRAYRA